MMAILIIEGLGLFTGILICHYNEERKQVYEKLKKDSPYKIYILTDDETIIVND